MDNMNSNPIKTIRNGWGYLIPVMFVYVLGLWTFLPSVNIKEVLIYFHIIKDDFFIVP